jgi:hypothetical protein
MEAIALQDQTLSDIAVRYCGTLEAVFDLALLNDLSITSELTPGQVLTIPATDYGFKEVVNYFATERIQPTTALSTELAALITDNGGIGSMAIETNLIVS